MKYLFKHLYSEKESKISRDAIQLKVKDIQNVIVSITFFLKNKEICM